MWYVPWFELHPPTYLVTHALWWNHPTLSPQRFLCPQYSICLKHGSGFEIGRAAWSRQEKMQFPSNNNAWQAAIDSHPALHALGYWFVGGRAAIGWRLRRSLPLPLKPEHTDVLGGRDWASLAQITHIKNARLQGSGHAAGNCRFLGL